MPGRLGRYTPFFLGVSRDVVIVIAGRNFHGNRGFV